MSDGRNRNGSARWAALAGLLLAFAGPVHAQIGAPSPPKFPAALDRDTLLGWLRSETDILPERVIAVTPQALTAVVSTFPGGGGQGPRMVVRAEALNAETFARTGALSWHVSLTADCAGRRVKLGDTTGYPERNLLGERRVLRPAEADWRTPEAGTALESALRAACDTGFKGPFAGDGFSTTAPAAGSPVAPQPDRPPPPAKVPQPAKPPQADKAPDKPAPKAPPPAPARAAPAPAKTTSHGAVSVQVGAYSAAAEAQAAMARLPQDRSRSLEQATVGGHAWYRLIVWGFASVQDAQRYCDQRKAAGGACFVRAPDKG
ncbi:MAG: SPOR domain-containing protein [Caulobacterales bacterium]|nr:SPOR domain-containing protein [Caulobacterales bacterium]